MSDTERQVRNRIAMWREQILDPSRDESIEASTATLLDSLEADVRTLTTMALLDEVAALRSQVAQAKQAVAAWRKWRLDLHSVVAHQTGAVRRSETVAVVAMDDLRAALRGDDADVRDEGTT